MGKKLDCDLLKGQPTRDNNPKGLEKTLWWVYIGNFEIIISMIPPWREELFPAFWAQGLPQKILANITSLI
jgi:hypothetical protein